MTPTDPIYVSVSARDLITMHERAVASREEAWRELGACRRDLAAARCGAALWAFLALLMWAHQLHVHYGWW